MDSSSVTGRRSLHPRRALSADIATREDITMHPLRPSQIQSDNEHGYLLENTGQRVCDDSNQDNSHHPLSSTVVGSHRPRLNPLKSWWQEVALSLLTIALLVTIISMLRAFNNEPLPEWSVGLNLNTVVALLATLIRSSLAMVVEEVLSQTKWTWQRHSRAVANLVAFDEASRGPLGSALLWFRVATSSGFSRQSIKSSQFYAAFIATIVGILSLAIGAFTQQAVKSVPCNIAVPGANVSLPLVYGPLDGMTMRYGAGLFDLDFATKGRLLRAFTGSDTERQLLIRGCPTGNCTFDMIAPGITHTMSGFCSKCLNTSHKVAQVYEAQERFNNTSYVVMLRLPTGLAVGPLIEYPVHVLQTGRGSSDWLKSELDSVPDYSKAFNSSAATVNILSLSTAGCQWSEIRDEWSVWHDYECPFPSERANRNKTKQERYLSWNVAAASCALYPCIQDMKAEIKNGVLHETKVSEKIIYPVNVSGEGHVGMFISPCFINGVRYDIPESSSTKPSSIGLSEATSALPAQCYYSVPRWIFMTMAIQDWFDDLLVGNCSIATNQGDSARVRSWALCDGGLGARWWLSGFYNRGNATFDSISTIMDGVATAITDSLRLGSIAQYGLNVNNTVNGTVWRSDVCTEFNWRWLLFPASLIVLTLVSLVSIMAASAYDVHKTPVWKSSILPFLYLRRSEMFTDLPSDSLQEMKKAAREEQVVLRRGDEDRWQLVKTKKQL
ncbi:hypothetical protein FB567DRAFT_535119 [Paraphoma chrysanthemicola]|uniref:Uncharacterized protein n=1 Tax=Paraphoma chrysanthemicola TaxID=798071 RepID=A0A8K0QXR8_9PLEO|nr:hypothetical protein FB567DRAFT_535119 [Paraphoma chrysanthemicola]